MQLLTQDCEQRWQAEERSRWVASAQGGAAVSSPTLFSQAREWSSHLEEFRHRDSEFADGYHALRARINEQRQQNQLSYGELLESLDMDDPNYATLRQISEWSRKKNSIKNKGPEYRKDMEQFFASEGGLGARDVLTYVDDAGNHVPYSDEQWQDILDGRTPQVDFFELHGHHINSVVGQLRRDVRDVGPLDDPDNIRMMTRAAHLSDELHGHGGSFHNETVGEAKDVESRFEAIRATNRQNVFDRVEDRELGLSLGAAVAFGSVAALIRFYQLRNDLRPWKQRTGMAAAAFALRGGETAIISYSALRARGELNEFVFDSADSFAENLGADFSGDVLAEILGSAAGFGTAMAVSGGLRLIKEYRAGASLRQVRTHTGNLVVVVVGEAGAFIILGVLVDAAGIPDPTGVLIVCRLLYAVGKLGHNYHQNVRSQLACLQCRLNVLYEQANQGLMPSPTSPSK